MALLTLRPAELADLDAILRIERSPGYELRVGRSPRPEHEAMLAGPRHAYFVGEREEIEAFAILGDSDDPYGNVYLKRIAALPGRRAGGPFLAQLIARVFARPQAHRFHLTCLDDNAPAQAFYARFGFAREGVAREAYLAPDGRRRDLVVMSLTRSDLLQHDQRALQPPMRL